MPGPATSALNITGSGGGAPPGPTGSGVANQVTFWSAPTVLTGAAGFEFFPGSDIFQIAPTTGTKRRFIVNLGNAVAPFVTSTHTLIGARFGAFDRWQVDIAGSNAVNVPLYEIRCAGPIWLTPRGKTTVANDNAGIQVSPVAFFSGSSDTDLMRFIGAAGGTNLLVGEVAGASVTGVVGFNVAVQATGAGNFFYAFRMNITETGGAPTNKYLLAKWQYNSIDVFAVGSDGDVTLAGDLSVGGQLQVPGTLTPAALAANEDDYAPAGLADITYLRLTPNAGGTTITGLAGGVAGRIILLKNINAVDTLSFLTENAGSVAANRFALRVAVVAIGPLRSVSLLYDGVASRWTLQGNW